VQGQKILKNTDVEDSDDENYIILRTEKTQEKEVEHRKEKSRSMITKSRALLDNLQEDSSNSQDEEGNHLVVSKEMAGPTSYK
jgi:hypothetical protein